MRCVFVIQRMTFAAETNWRASSRVSVDSDGDQRRACSGGSADGQADTHIDTDSECHNTFSARFSDGEDI